MKNVLAFLLITSLFNLPMLGYAQQCSGGGTGGGGGGGNNLYISYAAGWPTKGPAPDQPIQVGDCFCAWYDVTGTQISNSITLSHQPTGTDYYLYISGWGRPWSGYPLYSISVNGTSVYNHILTCPDSSLMDQDYVLMPSIPGGATPLVWKFLNPGGQGAFKRAAYFYQVIVIAWPHNGTTPGNNYHC